MGSQMFRPLELEDVLVAVNETRRIEITRVATSQNLSKTYFGFVTLYANVDLSGVQEYLVAFDIKVSSEVGKTKFVSPTPEPEKGVLTFFTPESAVDSFNRMLRKLKV
jgi:hypothetical protein